MKTIVTCPWNRSVDQGLSFSEHLTASKKTKSRKLSNMGNLTPNSGDSMIIFLNIVAVQQKISKYNYILRLKSLWSFEDLWSEKIFRTNNNGEFWPKLMFKMEIVLSMS